MTAKPAGEERQVKFLGGAAIDGAPIAYVVVLAAVVTALSFIPFSVVLASGGSFPMSQGIWALVGWILGPIAGAVANGVGQIIGVFMAPHTASVPLATVWWSVIAGLLAGSMVLGEKRKNWWLWLSVLVIAEFVLYAGRALVVNGVRLSVVFMNTFVDWSAILLYVLPTRTLFARWINGKNIILLAAGLFLGTWTISGLGHISRCVISYWLLNWPEQVWITLIPMIPMENLFRCLIGTVIGTGVIAGLRAIGLIKPENAIY